MSVNNARLVWVDLEMTGLVVEQDRIIEMAMIVTDAELTTIAEGPVCVIHQSAEVLSQMDEWNVKQHTHSGLIKRVEDSILTEEAAEKVMLDFVQTYVPAGAGLLCGNSVWQDRRFLARYMPELERYFHYRLIDVSTIKELAKYWVPDIYHQFHKQTKHLALDDIRDSIAELQYYRDTWLIPTSKE